MPAVVGIQKTHLSADKTARGWFFVDSIISQKMMKDVRNVSSSGGAPGSVPADRLRRPLGLFNTQNNVILLHVPKKAQRLMVSVRPPPNV